MIIFTKPPERSLRIGGTDVAAIMGKSDYKTYEQVLNEKAGLAEDKFSGNKFTESGHIYEPAVVKWYEDQTGESVMRPEEEAKADLLPGHTFVHPDYPFLVGSPDGLVRLNCRYKVSPDTRGLMVSGIKWGFEAKVAHYFSKRKWDAFEHKMPESYWMQCQYYMLLTDLKRWDLAVHHLGTADREIHRIDADPFIQQEMLEACVNLWGAVEEIKNAAKTT